MSSAAEKPVSQRIVVGAVIIHRMRVLLVRRAANDTFAGRWELPSGKRDMLEGSEAALVREVAEEVGIRIKPVAPCHVFDYTVEKPDAIRDTTQISYLARIQGSATVALSKEHDASAWVPRPGLRRYNITPETQAAILAGFALARSEQ